MGRRWRGEVVGGSMSKRRGRQREWSGSCSRGEELVGPGGAGAATHSREQAGRSAAWACAPARASWLRRASGLGEGIAGPVHEHRAACWVVRAWAHE